MTILIVDDNPGIRRLVRVAVAELAVVTWDCADGGEALAAYLTHRPDIVLMDIRMNCLDGLAATRQILAADPRATVVMLTDYDDDLLRAAAREAGARGYVLKSNLLDLGPFLESLSPQL